MNGRRNAEEIDQDYFFFIVASKIGAKRIGNKHNKEEFYNVPFIVRGR